MRGILMSEPALWELLAEEAVELAHAALKMSRYLRRENPVSPDLTRSEIFKKVEEEFNDLLIETDMLGVKFDPNMYGYKLERFEERCKNMKTEDEVK